VAAGHLYWFGFCLMSGVGRLVYSGGKRVFRAYSPLYRARWRGVDKYACFFCGAKFKLKSEVRKHEHYQVASIKDYRLEFI